MKPLKQVEILREHEGEWVVLNKQRPQILASGPSLEKLLNTTREIESENSIITFVPRFDTDYVG